MNGYESILNSAWEQRDDSVTKALLNKEAGWIEDTDHVVTFQDRVYVPRDKDLREEIMRLHHDAPTAGHPGRHRTVEMITRDYWWPSIRQTTRNYVDGCPTCQKVKPRTIVHAPLNPCHGSLHFFHLCLFRRHVPSHVSLFPSHDRASHTYLCTYLPAPVVCLITLPLFLDRSIRLPLFALLGYIYLTPHFSRSLDCPSRLLVPYLAI